MGTTIIYLMGEIAIAALLVSILVFSKCNSYSLYHFKWLIKEEWLFIFQHVHMCYFLES